MNALSGSVPNGIGVNPATVAVNYTSSGIYYYFPTKLKNVLKNKTVFLPIRYSSSALLTDDNTGGWQSIGKLWILSEMEVYGAAIWSDKKYSIRIFTQEKACRKKRQAVVIRNGKSGQEYVVGLTPQGI